jgi:probable F420-dependent oxidoreductase
MHVGVTLMLTDQALEPSDLAVAVEERGFYSLYVSEHTHLPVREAEPPALVPGVTLDGYRRSLDPLVTLTAAAAVTERIRLGAGVALVAQHDPIIMAKQIATLDHLSGGRFVLGVGYGWNRAELADHGVDYRTRRRLVREKLLCMQALWSQDEAEFHGELVDLPPSYAWPKPVQQPRVRTLIGGGAGPKLFTAIAELCDGWMPVGGAGLAKALPELRRTVAGAGRDPSELHIVPFGTMPDHGKLEHYAAIGVTEAVLRIPPPLTRDAVLRVLDDYTRFIPK